MYGFLVANLGLATGRVDINSGLVFGDLEIEVLSTPTTFVSRCDLRVP